MQRMWRNPRGGYAPGADRCTEEACQKGILSDLRAKEDNEGGKMKDLDEIKAMVFVIMLCALVMLIFNWFIFDNILTTRLSVKTIAREIVRMEK